MRKKAKLFQVPDEAIANFDETNVYFAPDTSSTIDWRGSRTVSVNKAQSSLRLIATIRRTKTGYKFPSYIIFKGKWLCVSLFPLMTNTFSSGTDKHGGQILKEVSKAKENGYAQGMFYTVQDEVWMYEKKMLEWVDKVWVLFCAKWPVTMLILDEAICHLTGKVRRKIEGLGWF